MKCYDGKEEMKEALEVYLDDAKEMKKEISLEKTRKLLRNEEFEFKDYIRLNWNRRR